MASSPTVNAIVRNRRLQEPALRDNRQSTRPIHPTTDVILLLEPLDPPIHQVGIPHRTSAITTIIPMNNHTGGLKKIPDSMKTREHEDRRQRQNQRAQGFGIYPSTSPSMFQ